MTHDAYCPDSFNYQRRNTREVKIGASALGGNNPIRVQSMTTTDTWTCRQRWPKASG